VVVVVEASVVVVGAKVVVVAGVVVGAGRVVVPPAVDPQAASTSVRTASRRIIRKA
jgi:hypothetical protein